MALNDLSSGLEAGSTILDSSTEASVLRCLAIAVQDNNGEVQNLAVRATGIIVRKCSETVLGGLINQYCLLMHTKEHKDIASLGLKTIVKECPVVNLVSPSFVERILPGVFELSKHFITRFWINLCSKI